MIDLLACPHRSSIEGKVCIVGSGLAGAIVAVELAKAGIDTVKLAAGPSRLAGKASIELDQQGSSAAALLGEPSRLSE